MSLLTEMTPIQEMWHEADKKLNLEKHWLAKDQYSKPEMQEMCFRCCDHYKWNELLEYDTRTNTYYKVKS